MQTLIGRDRETTALRTLISALPRGGLIIVEGEPGIGKSALLDVAVSQAGEAGVRVVRVCADELSGNRPFGLYSSNDELVPSIRGGGSFGADNVVEMIVSPALDQPFLLLIDDLQWADSTSVAWLPSVVRRSLAAGGAVVIAVRSGIRSIEVEQAIERLEVLEPLRLALGPLSLGEIVGVASNHVESAVAERSRSMLAKAGGNPLYASLLVVGQEGKGGAGGDDPLATVRETVLRRARLLGTTVFKVLRVAALFGRRFDLHVIARILSMSVMEVAHAVTLATDAGLLVSNADGCAFRHDLVREALQQELPHSVRATMHRLALDAMVDAGAPAEDLVVHLLAADVVLGDVGELLAGAACSTPATALALLDRARKVLPADDDRRDQLEVDRAEKLLWAGRVQESMAAVEALLERSLEPGLASQLRTARIRSLYLSGRASVALDHHRLLPPKASAPLRARELADLAMAAAIARRFADGRDMARQAIAISDDDQAAIFALMAMAWVDLRTGDLALAETSIDRAVELGERTSFTGTRIGPLLTRAVLRHSQGDCDGALADAKAGHGAVDDHTSTMLVPFLHAASAGALLDAGRWDDAQAEIDAGRTASDELNVRLAGGWLDGIAAIIDVYRNGVRYDIRLTSEPLSIVDDKRRFATAISTELHGDRESAFEQLAECVEAPSGIGDRNTLVVFGADFARLAFVLGQPDRATPIIEAVSGIRSDRDPIAVMTGAWIEGLRSRDVEVLARTAHSYRRMRPFHTARMLEHAMHIASEHHQRARAREFAVAALAAYDAVGADHLARMLRRESQRLGIRVRKSSSTRERFGPAAVTPTEAEILDLVALGRSNQAIADQLVMSRRTVESHLGHVYTKLGMTSRVELVRHLLTA